MVSVCVLGGCLVGVWFVGGGEKAKSNDAIYFIRTYGAVMSGGTMRSSERHAGKAVQ